MNLRPSWKPASAVEVSVAKYTFYLTLPYLSIYKFYMGVKSLICILIPTQNPSRDRNVSILLPTAITYLHPIVHILLLHNIIIIYSILKDAACKSRNVFVFYNVNSTFCKISNTILVCNAHK